jgi:RNA ligase (TIGR02306 family)
MRKLATIRKIDALDPIEGADKIEVATVGGWKVVAQKGLYKVGDLAAYFEVDSWMPHKLAPFLTKPGQYPKVFEGIEGERLKTIRLRGQLSQGLLMPLDEVMPETHSFGEDSDVTEHFGIVKWEKAVPANLAGLVKGNFPTMIPKTDQERAQNLVKEIVAANEAGVDFTVEEKIDGSSMTCYLIDGVFGTCSRNLDLKRDENNSFWAVAIRDGIEDKMRTQFGDADFAIQGELVGPGVQGNLYNLSKLRYFVFDIYDIRKGTYVDPATRRAMVTEMGLDNVPVLAANATLYDTLGITDMPGLLKFAEGKSVLGDITGPEREGVVFKENSGGFTFKVVSNAWLLKHE